MNSETRTVAAEVTRRTAGVSDFGEWQITRSLKIQTRAACSGFYFKIVKPESFRNCERMHRLTPELEEWLRKFSLAVRSRNYEAGKALFDPEVISFGTICFRADAREELENSQWKKVWPSTSGFDFEYDSAVATADAQQAVMLASWNSVTENSGGQSIKRRGRATLVLQKNGAQWKAVHTHFSLTPQNDPLLRRISPDAHRVC